MSENEEKIVYAITKEFIQSRAIGVLDRELRDGEIDSVYAEMIGTSDIINCIDDAIQSVSAKKSVY